MEHTNILLTCAGRRNDLVCFFQDVLTGRGKVLVSDAHGDAPALQQADKAFLVPPVNHGDYIDILLSICKQYDVRLLFPLNDLELQLSAQQRDRFLAIGTLPVVSSPDVINICFDKWATHNFMTSIGLDVPKTYLVLAEARRAIAQGVLRYPVVIKPRWGTASMGIAHCADDEEMELSYKYLSKYLTHSELSGASAADPERCVLIQEKIHGQEYGLDVVNDLHNRYVCTFIRRKIRMRAGETDCAITVQNDSLERLGEVLGARLGHIGNLDCDVFMAGTRCYVLDLNPRFGGGYPFTHVAGANLPAALVAWGNCEEPDRSWFRVRTNVTVTRYGKLMAINEKGDERCAVSEMPGCEEQSEVLVEESR